MTIKTAHLSTASVAIGEAQGLINLDERGGVYDADAIPALLDAIRELAAANDELVALCRELVAALEAQGAEVDHSQPN